LQDEYESFLDGDERDLHQLKQVKSIKKYGE
ncbi:MAG: hypothetical protein K0R09_3807, partial [Clostridiales bacterium]|nr:hypothetical protein [Clostridiales bacterium]